MRLGRPGFLAFVFATVASCESDEMPAWVGVYTLRADTVRYCVENTTATGRTCDCTAPGHMEGSISLRADASYVPSGEVKLRECPTGAPCLAEVTLPVIEYHSFPPRITSADSVNFCAGKCTAIFGDGGIDFSVATVQGGNLKGWFRRSDGNVRACGADHGPFTATRR
jgi:hypothetical protein